MVSIIIVNYRVKPQLFVCIQSILDNHITTTPYEIIVVDNDEKKTLKSELYKKFSHVKYISNKNRGFGEGNNAGALQAKGEFLFFLNPDTKIYPNSIDALVSYLKKKKDVAIAAPILYGHSNKIVPLQGTITLSPLNAIFSFSLVAKLLPDNRIFRKYWLLDEWDKRSIREVDTVPGTAFMIRRNVFTEINGFDDKFFLYFEEHDLCKRARELGWKIVMHPKARVFHELGGSTKQSNKDIADIFKQSRYYYFRKHFGIIPAFLSEAVLRFNKYAALLFLIVILGAFLRLYKLDETMPFIGDQGWFYLSARDMLLSGEIPLVGIASSHPWLFQGAFWTYLLAGMLAIFKFNPISGAYLSAFFDILAIIFIYKLGSEIFSKRIGIIASALYATSLLVVMNARMSYHTAPIPFLSILFIWFLFKWINGRLSFFPWIIAVLSVLYNFVLATFLFSIVFILVFLFGLFSNKIWARGVVNKKIIIYSVIAFIIPMTPMIIHDVNNYYGQTIGIIAWLGYKLLLALGYPTINPINPAPLSEILAFLKLKITQLIFPHNSIVAVGVLFLSSLYLSIKGIEKKNTVFIYLGSINFFLFIGLVASRVPSEAYLPMIFPGIIIQLAVFLDVLFKRRILVIFGVLVLIMFMMLSSIYLLKKDFYHDPQAKMFSMTRKINVAKEIILQSGGKEYNLKAGAKDAIPHVSAAMNYEYLTWWLGHGPSGNEEKMQFLITEDNKGITITKKVLK